MELVKLGQKGQLTIPRAILRAASIYTDTPLAIAVAPDGAIVLRSVGVYPFETYTHERIEEFESHNRIPTELATRAEALIAQHQAHT